MFSFFFILVLTTVALHDEYYEEGQDRHCPAGFMLAWKMCYYWSEFPENFTEANEFCRKRGAVLSPTSSAQHLFLELEGYDSAWRFPNLPKWMELFWAGLHRNLSSSESEDSWEWWNGESVKNNRFETEIARTPANTHAAWNPLRSTFRPVPDSTKLRFYCTIEFHFQKCNILWRRTTVISERKPVIIEFSSCCEYQASENTIANLTEWECEKYCLRSDKCNFFHWKRIPIAKTDHNELSSENLGTCYWSLNKTGYFISERSNICGFKVHPPENYNHKAAVVEKRQHVKAETKELMELGCYNVIENLSVYRKCYTIALSETEDVGANDNCKGNLAVISTEEDLRPILDLLETSPYTEFWIDLTRNAKGQWNTGGDLASAVITSRWANQTTNAPRMYDFDMYGYIHRVEDIEHHRLVPLELPEFPMDHAVLYREGGKILFRPVNNINTHPSLCYQKTLLRSSWKILYLITAVILLCLRFIIFAAMHYRKLRAFRTARKRWEESYYELFERYQNLQKGQATGVRFNSEGEEPVLLPLRQRSCGYEISDGILTIGELLGTGQFGTVSLGTIKKSGEECQVAVKEPQRAWDQMYRDMLAEEIVVMQQIGQHPNVLALLAVDMKEYVKGKLYIITEYCKYGNLRDVLRHCKESGRFENELRTLDGRHMSYAQPNSAWEQLEVQQYTSQYDSERRKREPPLGSLILSGNPESLCTSDLLSFAMQAANGMDYVANKTLVHRDLAARNILLTVHGVIKIADFGMAKDTKDKLYYREAAKPSITSTIAGVFKKKKNTLFPIRWMSIEALETLRFTTESDVWSFGILVYELFTLAEELYPNVRNADLLVKLKSGYRNPKPENCHQEIYELMQLCWEAQPSRRPTFGECYSVLADQLGRAAPQLLERVHVELEREAMRQEEMSNFCNVSKWSSRPKLGGRK